MCCINRIPDKYRCIEPTDVVLLEGILTFYWPEVRDFCDMKLFVDTDADTRLARRGKCVTIVSFPLALL